MNYRAALFDFDGTLAPSLPLWLKAYHLTFAHYGIVLSDEEMRRRCFFRDWGELAADFAVCSAQELQLRMDVSLKQSFAEAELFPQAQSLIEHCRLHGMQTALVTSSPRGIVIDVIARLQLSELFDFVICGDDVQNYKPHPEPLLTTLAALGRLPADAIMIGDSHVDILAGKAAGTHTALFLPEDHGRFHDAEKLRALGPDHVFADHCQLPALLGLPHPAWFDEAPAVS